MFARLVGDGHTGVEISCEVCATRLQKTHWLFRAGSKHGRTPDCPLRQNGRLPSGVAGQLLVVGRGVVAASRLGVARGLHLLIKQTRTLRCS